MSARGLVKKYTKQAKQLLDKGKLLEAREIYFKASQLDTNDDNLWVKLGEISSRLNHHQDSETAFRRAIAINSNAPGYYLELGKTQVALKNFPAAEQNFKTYTTMCPDAEEGYQALASLMKHWGRMKEAEQYYQRILALTPNDENTLLQWANILQQMGKHKKAVATYQRILKLIPESWEAFQGLGTSYCAQHKFDLAHQAFKQGLNLFPEREADYQCNLVNLYYESGDWEQALTHCNEALQSNPKHIHARMQRAYILLGLGHWKQGWVEYESRLQHPAWLQKHPRPLSSAPLWQGEELPNATILVEEDEGYGDSFQFCRYLPLLAERCNKVIVRCRPATEKILSRIKGVAAIIPITASSTDIHIDRCVYMMSLPHLLGPEPDGIVRDIPYLSIDPSQVQKWKNPIHSEGLKVGLVWAGSATHGKDSSRSIPFSLFAPFENIEGVSFYSLQKGPPTAQLENSPFPITDLGSQFEDFSDTAAAIINLDLVISVDTSIAHLAGGLGKPVWMLSYFPGDWRWGFKGSETVWYPTMKIFRQDNSCNWEPVIKQMLPDLLKLAR